MRLRSQSKDPTLVQCSSVSKDFNAETSNILSFHMVIFEGERESIGGGERERDFLCESERKLREFRKRHREKEGERARERESYRVRETE